MNKYDGNLDSVSTYAILEDAVHSKYSRKFVLKGGVALMSKVLDNSREHDLFRKTVDIDIHCNSTDIWNAFCSEVEQILNKSTLYEYKLKGRRALTWDSKTGNWK
jgi:hypothetical protein